MEGRRESQHWYHSNMLSVLFCWLHARWNIDERIFFTDHKNIRFFYVSTHRHVDKCKTHRYKFGWSYENCWFFCFRFFNGLSSVFTYILYKLSHELFRIWIFTKRFFVILSWPNTLFSCNSGLQHWCDEFARWVYPVVVQSNSYRSLWCAFGRRWLGNAVVNRYIDLLGRRLHWISMRCYTRR